MHSVQIVRMRGVKGDKAVTQCLSPANHMQQVIGPLHSCRQEHLNQSFRHAMDERDPEPSNKLLDWDSLPGARDYSGQDVRGGGLDAILDVVNLLAAEGIPSCVVGVWALRYYGAGRVSNVILGYFADHTAEIAHDNDQVGMGSLHP